MKLAKGDAIQSRSTCFANPRKASRVSEIVCIPSFRRDEVGDSINSSNTLAVSLDIDAMDVVSGDDDIDCKVCTRGVEG